MNSCGNFQSPRKGPAPWSELVLNDIIIGRKWWWPNLMYCEVVQWVSEKLRKIRQQARILVCDLLNMKQVNECTRKRISAKVKQEAVHLTYLLLATHTHTSRRSFLSFVFGAFSSTLWRRKNWNHFSEQCSPIFGRFPRFSCLSWVGQQLDVWSIGGIILTGRTEVLWWKKLSATLGGVGSNSGYRCERPPPNCISHGRAFSRRGGAWKYFPTQCSPISERVLLAGSQGQYVDLSIGGVILTGIPKYCEQNLTDCYFIYHKSHIEWPGKETGLLR